MTSPISQEKLEALIEELEKRVKSDFAGVCYDPKFLLSIATELRKLRETSVFSQRTIQDLSRLCFPEEDDE